MDIGYLVCMFWVVGLDLGLCLVFCLLVVMGVCFRLLLGLNVLFVEGVGCVGLML